MCPSKVAVSVYGVTSKKFGAPVSDSAQSVRRVAEHGTRDARAPQTTTAVPIVSQSPKGCFLQAKMNSKQRQVHDLKAQTEMTPKAGLEPFQTQNILILQGFQALFALTRHYFFTTLLPLSSGIFWQWFYWVSQIG
jgi:hypothetical protein